MSENSKDLFGKAHALYDEAKTILSNPDAVAEDFEKADKLYADAEKLMARGTKLDKITNASEVLAGLAKSAEDNQGPEQSKEAPKKAVPFGSWDNYLRAVWRANHKDAGFRMSDPRLSYFRDETKSGLEAKTMSGQTGAGGGFLIPEEFLANLYAAMGENTIVRSRASVIRMNSRTVRIPVLDQTGTTAGVPHWFGGFKFYWEEEAAEKTESDAEFRNITLEAKKLIGYTRASDELVQDSAISLADMISGPLGFAGGIAWTEDYNFLRGTGAGQPLGVLNAGATLTVNRNTAGTVVYDDLVNMMESFLPTGRGVWVITHNAMSNLLLMNGPAANPAYLWGNATAGAPNTLLGMPVIFTEKLPGVGTAGDVLLADFSYYLIGDRQATTIESTQYDYWRYDQTSWRAVHRVDGQPWLSAPLTFQDGTVQVSPFVILGDVASS